MVPAIDARPAIVLRVEARWLQAVRRRDSHTLASILAPAYIHIDYRGDVRSRSDELAAVVRPKEYAEHTSDRTVEFVRDIAIVHGLNTVTRGTSTVATLRYTDIYEWLDGRWQTIYSQETPVLK